MVLRVRGAIESKPLLACSPDLYLSRRLIGNRQAIVCLARFLGVDQALGTCVLASDVDARLAFRATRAINMTCEFTQLSAKK